MKHFNRTRWRVLCPHNHVLKTTTTTGDIREFLVREMSTPRFGNPSVVQLPFSPVWRAWAHGKVRLQPTVVGIFLGLLSVVEGQDGPRAWQRMQQSRVDVQ